MDGRDYETFTKIYIRPVVSIMDYSYGVSIGQS